MYKYYKTDNPKHQTIINLRLSGMSYGAIAKSMGLTKSTVATICRRAGIKVTDPEVIKKGENEIFYCKNCYQPFLNPWNRKTKLFCSPTCHDKWWNEERRKRKLAERSPRD